MAYPSDCSTCPPTNCGVITIIQGYQKTYYANLIYLDTQTPFDLTSATEINVAHPGSGAFPIIESLAPSLLTTGDTLSGSTQVQNLASSAGLVPGLPIFGAGIPSGTYLVSVLGTTATLSQAATATATAASLTFGNSNVSVMGAPGAGRIQVTIPAIDSAQLLINPSPQQNQDLQISVTTPAGTSGFLLRAVLQIVAPAYGVV